MICSQLVIDLGNPFEIVVHYLLIGGMISLAYRDEVSMVSVLVYIYSYTLDRTHKIRL